MGCADDPQPMPSVTLISDATAVALGQGVTLTWETRHASYCTAEGAWSGRKAANGSESVAVPLTQARNTFGLACTKGSRTARAEVVVSIRPPRFSMQALPLSVAIDLNDAGDVLGHDHGNAGNVPDYERYEDDPVVWTTTGMLRITTPCPMACRPELPLCRVGCPPGYSLSLRALNNHRTVLMQTAQHATGRSSRLVPLGGQPLPMWEAQLEYPHALNDAAQVVGCCSSWFGIPPPYLYTALLVSAGQLVEVQPPGRHGVATAINEAGVVAGAYTTPGDRRHVFRYENGLAADLGTLADGAPMPRSINAAGTIVGTVELASYPTSDVRAFRVRSGGSALEALPDLGGGQSTVAGVNDLEQVVGSSTLGGAPDTWRATLLSGGTLYDLNDLVVAAGDVTLDSGIDINNVGQVLVEGCDASGSNCRPYLLTPTSPVLGSSEIVFNFNFSSATPAPPFSSVTYGASFDASDPVNAGAGDVFVVSLYGGLNGTELIQTRMDPVEAGGTTYGPWETANPMFNPMLDGVYSIGLKMSSGTARLVSLTSCVRKAPAPAGPCQVYTPRDVPPVR
jgi:probable HAF family extracellular repeat protein